MVRVILTTLLIIACYTIQAQDKPKTKEEDFADKNLVVNAQSQQAKEVSLKFKNETDLVLMKKVTKDGKVVLFVTRRQPRTVRSR